MTQTDEKARAYHCPNCAAPIAWNIEDQTLSCEYCDSVFPMDGSMVGDHAFDEFAARSQSGISFPDQTLMSCTSCGAQVTFSSNRTAAVCPMCASSQILESKQSAGVPPDGILPFRVTKANAQQIFTKWVQGRWLAPGALKTAYREEKVEGVYIPFWVFDTKAQASYSGRGGNRKTFVDKDAPREKKYNWTFVNGTVSGSYDDFQVCAGTKKVQSLVKGILPYSTQNNSVPYNSAFLAGFSAERYAVEAGDAMKEFTNSINSDMLDKAETDITSNLGYDTADVYSSDVHVSLSDTRYKQILLPLWISTFTYGDKTYSYLINGETGKIKGDYPISVPKVLAIIAAVLIIFYFLTS